MILGRMDASAQDGDGLEVYMGTLVCSSKTKVVINTVSSCRVTEVEGGWSLKGVGVRSSC